MLRNDGAMIRAGREKVAWNVAVMAVEAGIIQGKRLDWMVETVGVASVSDAARTAVVIQPDLLKIQAVVARYGLTVRWTGQRTRR